MTHQSVSHIVPILAIVGYLLFPKSARIDPQTLHNLAILHNLILVLFSGWTFCSFVNILRQEGLVIGSGHYFENPHFDRVMFWFMISKYYEFFDTFLLYLNGKTPIFLQRFHHIGAVISWHLGYVYRVDCFWIPSTFNSFVHTLMYSYYLGCLLKIKQVRFIKKYMTSLQLIQLVTCVISGNVLYFNIESPINRLVIIFSTLYLLGLIVLFGLFYKKTYIDQKEKMKGNQ